MELSDIFSFDHLYAAHRLARRGRQHKRAVILFELDLAHHITQLMQKCASGKYRLGAYHAFEIHDPKPRLIEALSYADRVVLMCLCRFSIAPRLDPRLIYDNAASRVGRGTDFAIRRLHKFMRRQFIVNRAPGYFLKCDIAKYFQNIDHDILLAQLGRCGFGAGEMAFMEMVIRSHGTVGLPLGNQTSQWFALLYMNTLDRMIKEKLRIRGYVRYMDDFVLLAPEIDTLRRARAAIAEYCETQLKLHLNAKTQIGRLCDGVDFLGYHHRMTDTGRIVRRMRASARRRMGRYMRTIGRHYVAGAVDDAWLRTRAAAFAQHTRGTVDAPRIANRIKTMRRMKKLKIIDKI